MKELLRDIETLQKEIANDRARMERLRQDEAGAQRAEMEHAKAYDALIQNSRGKFFGTGQTKKDIAEHVRLANEQQERRFELSRQSSEIQRNLGDKEKRLRGLESELKQLRDSA